MPDLLDGLVIKAQSGFFTVHTGTGDVVCQVRGRLKQVRRDTDLVAVGDRVRISVAEDGAGKMYDRSSSCWATKGADGSRRR